MNTQIRPFLAGRINRDLAESIRDTSSTRHFADPSRVGGHEIRVLIGNHWVRPAQAVAFLDRLHREELTLDQPC